MLSNNRGVVLSLVLIMMALIATMGTAATVLTKIGLMLSANHRGSVKALYLAEGAANYGKVALAFSEPGVITFDSAPILGSNATGQVVITPDTINPDLATVVSIADYFTSRAIVEIGVEKTMPTWPGVGGAVTANGPTLTNGEISIDGRNHDLNGNMIAGDGGPGLITGSSYSQNGASLVGGSFEGADHPPSSPGDSSVIREGVADLASTPDEVVGLFEGALKRIAMSGVQGGQYVTDPSDLTAPLSGVTYVELPAGSDWWIVSDSTILDGGTGVLVVHNSTTNAKIKNLNEGTFKGLIIADDIVHIHTRIIGALISLTPYPSEGNAIGNGSGEVLFSREAFQGINYLYSIKQTSWKHVF